MLEMVSLKKTRHLRVILLGGANVGKTSFLHAYSRHQPRTAFAPTCGFDISFSRVDIKDQPILLELWDTAGTPRYQEISFKYVAQKHGVVLMYDVSDESSLVPVEGWIDRIKREFPSLSVLVVANKVDVLSETESSGASEKVRERGERLLSEGRVLAERKGVSFSSMSVRSGERMKESVGSFLKEILVAARDSERQSKEKRITKKLFRRE